MYHSLTKLTMTTLSLYLLLSLLPLLASASKIGVTYTPTATSPNPDLISAYAHKHSISTVRLTDPSPSTVRSFSYSNTTLLISLPNSLIPPFSANASNVETYLFSRIVPFYPRANIVALSLGSDPLSATSDLSDLLLPALRNLRSALDKLSLSKISVSTTLSFITTVTTAFPPSSAELLLPASEVVFKPLLSFLSETNASLFMNLYPYHVYKLRGDVPVGFALFQNYPYEFIDDKVTGVRYRNLFDMMVDAVVGAMAVAGHENIPIVLAETGWPASGADADANLAYAGMYNRGLIRHLREGFGTPLRKEGVLAAYIYEMFDSGRNDNRSDVWGMYYPNMTKKYEVDFSVAVARVVYTAAFGTFLLFGIFFPLLLSC